MCSWISKTNISLITIWTSELQIKSIISFGYDNIGNASKHEIRCVCYKLLARHSLKLNPIAVLASERSNFAGTQEQARQKGPINVSTEHTIPSPCPAFRTTLAFHKLWHIRRDTLRRRVCSYAREGEVRKMLKLHGMFFRPCDSAREGDRNPRLAWLRHVPG